MTRRGIEQREREIQHKTVTSILTDTKPEKRLTNKPRQVVKKRGAIDNNYGRQ